MTDYTPDDSVEYSGPVEEWLPSPGNAQETSVSIYAGESPGYHNIDLLTSLIEAIINENTQLIQSAEASLVDYNLIIDDNNLKAAQLAEWPDELGSPKDYISYPQYKALKTLDTRGSAYIINFYNDKIRSASGTNAIDIINISDSIRQEALNIKDFLNDAVGTVSDSAEFRVVELLQDWAGTALKDTRLFRGFFEKKGEGLQQIPASELANLTPQQASQYQAVFQIKLNLINQDLNKFETNLAQANGQYSEIFYKRFLGPALKVKLNVTNGLAKLADNISYLGQQAFDATNGLTSDFQTALADQLSRNSIYLNTMSSLKDRVAARDVYASNVQQLASIGTPIPKVFVAAKLTTEEKSTWDRIAAINPAASSTSGTVGSAQSNSTSTPAPSSPPKKFLSLHNFLDGRQAPDAHDQYLLKSKGIITGDISVLDGLRVDGVDINEHIHNGKDGSKPISGFAITEGSIPTSAASTDPPPVPTDFKLKLFQSKVLPPGVLSIDATLGWEGSIYHTFEIQIVKDNV